MTPSAPGRAWIKAPRLPGLRAENQRLARQMRVFAVAIGGHLQPRCGLQNGLRPLQVAGFQQRHLDAGHRPDRPQHAQHLADAGLYRRLGGAVGGALQLPAHHRQHAARLFGHAQQRQRACRAQLGHGAAAQRIQRGGF